MHVRVDKHEHEGEEEGEDDDSRRKCVYEGGQVGSMDSSTRPSADVVRPVHRRDLMGSSRASTVVQGGEPVPNKRREDHADHHHGDGSGPSVHAVRERARASEGKELYDVETVKGEKYLDSCHVVNEEPDAVQNKKAGLSGLLHASDDEEIQDVLPAQQAMTKGTMSNNVVNGKTDVANDDEDENEDEDEDEDDEDKNEDKNGDNNEDEDEGESENENENENEGEGEYHEGKDEAKDEGSAAGGEGEDAEGGDGADDGNAPQRRQT
ncbi:PREDICTED: acidic leucine-rich nuclear phosphoprotein 32-related protein-like [Eufriesea mexicana]|uniref:acidic leucine-rich nuclear phosphoprotein 32-related protein-like n=1 Tax=Eufriesea mexicana TaxID=516756 RepID=UPI00083C8FAF|nr:PREDICTED: acidic leucine-rich nuclear phosphoprotein 32-related protein-like [Eufriesea mexicana]